MGTRTIASVLGVLLALAAPLATAGGRPSAKDGFKALVERTTPGDTPAHPEALPKDLAPREAQRDEAALAAWRRETVIRLGKAAVKAVREKGDRALVHAELDGETVEIPLRWDGARWALDAPQEYVVTPATLGKANAAGALRVSLDMRKTNGAYGGSAYAFTWMSKDAEAVKNRVDVWYCHNGDLHVSGEGEIADVGGIALAKAARIPVEAAWSDGSVKPQKGRTYVVRCRRLNSHDYYVALRVEKVTPTGLEFTWTLLALGAGGPKALDAPAPPPDPLDGADGFDGLCGKNP